MDLLKSTEDATKNVLMTQKINQFVPFHLYFGRGLGVHADGGCLPHHWILDCPRATSATTAPQASHVIFIRHV
jgi:hypothetical protein